MGQLSQNTLKNKRAIKQDQTRLEYTRILSRHNPLDASKAGCFAKKVLSSSNMARISWLTRMFPFRVRPKFCGRTSMEADAGFSAFFLPLTGTDFLTARILRTALAADLKVRVRRQRTFLTAPSSLTAPMRHSLATCAWAPITASTEAGVSST